VAVNSIGTDIEEIERVKEVVTQWGDRFLRRVFTDKEIDYCNSLAEKYGSLAARFAAKEAILKAIGISKGHGIRWKDIEILNHKNGKPRVKLHNNARKHVKDEKRVLISLSHARKYVVAMAVIS
jgi:holo-[acyl-carrier protein] synthase